MASTEESSRKAHENRRCLFCEWVKKWDKKEDYRLIRNENNEDFFAVLANEPKVFGHTLLISKHPYDSLCHKLVDSKDGKKAILEFLPVLCRAVKEGLHAEVAYVTCMCDHWEKNELQGRHSTEHLHFHILPRYSGNERGESLFCLPDKKAGLDWEANPISMEQARDAVRRALEKD